MYKVEREDDLDGNKLRCLPARLSFTMFSARARARSIPRRIAAALLDVAIVVLAFDVGLFITQDRPLQVGHIFCVSCAAYRA